MYILFVAGGGSKLQPPKLHMLTQWLRRLCVQPFYDLVVFIRFLNVHSLLCPSRSSINIQIKSAGTFLPARRQHSSPAMAMADGGCGELFTGAIRLWGASFHSTYRRSGRRMAFQKAGKLKWHSQFHFSSFLSIEETNNLTKLWFFVIVAEEEMFQECRTSFQSVE